MSDDTAAAPHRADDTAASLRYDRGDRGDGRDDAERVDVVVVGSGFAGLAMAIALKRQGRRDFVVLEKADALGGTWRDNTYPGCACDIPAHLYCFSFAPNPAWSRAYSGWSEIQGYLRRCAAAYGVAQHLRFGTRLQSARYDEPTGEWSLTVAGMAGQRRLRCRSLVLALGALHEPADPHIEGLDMFTGRLTHTSRWDSSVRLEGQRVGVIGTGASAIQVVPAIAPEAAHVTVFQRTPPWVLPKHDRAFSDRQKAAFARLPGLARAYRSVLFWRTEAQAVGFLHPRLMPAAARQARRHLARQVTDRVLREKLTPSYTMGCKRVLVSSGYYPALVRDDVHVDTAGIERIEGNTVHTLDGGRHDLDVLVLATGFDVNGSYSRLEVVGEDGRSLAGEWATAPEAFLGLTVDGFPNLFTLLGPNTGLGHSSVVLMAEAQVGLAVQAMDERDRRGAASIAVRPQVQARFNHELRRRSAATVWLTGCRSWYLDRAGVNRAIWPGSVLAFRRRTRRLDPDDYRFLGTLDRQRKRAVAERAVAERGRT